MEVQLILQQLILEKLSELLEICLIHEKLIFDGETLRLTVSCISCW